MKQITIILTLFIFLSPQVAWADFVAPPPPPPPPPPVIPPPPPPPPVTPPAPKPMPKPKASVKKQVVKGRSSGSRFATRAGISFGACMVFSGAVKGGWEDEDFLGCGVGALADAAAPGLGFFANQFTRCVVRGGKHGWEKDYAGWSVKGPRRGGCNNDSTILRQLEEKYQSGLLTGKEKKLYKIYKRRLQKRKR